MFSSLQPARPKAPTHQSQPPLFQQQTRTTASAPAQPAPQGPRSQMEAMPPHGSPPHVRAASSVSSFNPAVTHPVFFTQAWRKPPFSMPGTSGFSPVATGYVFGTRPARKQPTTKL